MKVQNMIVGKCRDIILIISRSIITGVSDPSLLVESTDSKIIESLGEKHNNIQCHYIILNKHVDINNWCIIIKKSKHCNKIIIQLI